MKTDKTTGYWNPLGSAKAVLTDKLRDMNTILKFKELSNNPMMYYSTC